MADISETALAEPMAGNDAARTKLVAAGGILGAIGASACCIVPLVLFSLGVGGVWIGRLTALSPYQPVFIALTFGFLGYGYWLVYRKPAAACADGAACARPLPNRVVKAALWAATALVVLALAWPWLLPIIFR